MQVLIVTLFLMSFFTVSIAHSQQLMQKTVSCTSREKAVSYLKEEHNESVIMSAVNMNNGAFIEWWENDNIGSWTLIEHNNITACILASGIKGTKT
jgi:hypothetical protein